MRVLVMLALVLGLPAAANAQKNEAFSDCARCHTAKDWKRIEVRSAIDHAKTGFRLLGRHATTSCVACHRAGLDLRSPWPGACVTCHEDKVHRGALGRECAGCHTATTWKLPRAREIHARSRFPLTGSHLSADCTSCHRRADQGLYRDAPVACIGCHQKDYQRPGIQPDHVRGGFSTDCAGCHRTSTFRPARFVHAQFFPLRGGHTAVACESCHPGDRFGGTPRACEGCHASKFAVPKMPDHVASGFPMDCARCHTDAGWKPARGDWHDSVFPITRGAHSGTPCLHCHPTTTDPRIFRCTNCHTADKVTPEHREVSGYVFEDRSCYQCHPKGKGD
jgi:hypothetical protein